MTGRGRVGTAAPLWQSGTAAHQASDTIIILISALAKLEKK